MWRLTGALLIIPGLCWQSATGPPVGSPLILDLCELYPGRGGFLGQRPSFGDRVCSSQRRLESFKQILLGSKFINRISVY